MINTVRNTVLSILNKNNYGYISPSDFNLFAKQAQLDIFEGYFYNYNRQINKENVRQSGTDYANIVKEIEFSIDKFSDTKDLYLDSDNKYYLPSLTTTGNDYYLVNKVLVKSEIKVDGVTTAFSVINDEVEDSAADFITDGIEVGDLVAIESSGVQYARVLAVNSSINLSVDSVLFTAAGIKYSIYASKSKYNELEKVTHGKITMLNNSILTSPTIMFPAYTAEDISLTAFPDTINAVGRITAQYIRYPKEPKWTYLTLANGEPTFDQTQPDYQDFELPLVDETHLATKILQYAGISIREAEVARFASEEEMKNKQEQL